MKNPGSFAIPLLVVVGSTMISVSNGFKTISNRPIGLLGKESLLDMVGSYLDNLGKPSYSSPGEVEKKGPKTSYMYTYNKGSSVNSKHKSGAFSGGSYLDNIAAPSSYLGDLKQASAQPVMEPAAVDNMVQSAFDASRVESSAPVTSGNYLSNLSKQPQSFTKPKTNFMYKGGPKAASGGAGVNSGNYLNNIPPTGAGSSAAPTNPTAVAPAAVTPPPQVPQASGKTYLDNITGGAAPMRSDGYTYKPKKTGHKEGPKSYLDTMGKAAAPAAASPPAAATSAVPPPPPPAAQVTSSDPFMDAEVVSRSFTAESAPAAPRGNYMESLGSSSAPPRKQGGYMYKPSGTGQKKAAQSDYLSSVGSGPQTRSPETVQSLFREFTPDASKMSVEKVPEEDELAYEDYSKDFANPEDAITKQRVSTLEMALKCAKLIKEQVEEDLEVSAESLSNKSAKLTQVANELDLSIEKLVKMGSFRSSDDALSLMERELAMTIRKLDRLSYELLKFKNEMAAETVRTEAPRGPVAKPTGIPHVSKFEILRAAFKAVNPRASDSPPKDAYLL